MAKKILGVIALTIALLIAVAGCTECSSCDSSTRTTTTTEETVMVPTLVETPTLTDREVEVKLAEKTVIFTDISLSVGSPEAEMLKEARKELIKEFPRAVVREFAEHANGELNPQWTDLFSALSKAKSDGYDRLFVLTDGWQDLPDTGWAGLLNQDYSFMDIVLVCAGKTAHTEELKGQLEAAPECFQHTSLRIEYLDGAPTEVLYSGYTPEVGIGIVPDADTLYHLEWTEVTAEPTAAPTTAPEKVVAGSCASCASCAGFPWWIFLLLLPLLVWALWRLLRGGSEEENIGRQPVKGSKPVGTGTLATAPIKGSTPGMATVEELPTRKPAEADSTTPATQTPTAEPVPPTPTPTTPSTPAPTEACSCTCCSDCCPLRAFYRDRSIKRAKVVLKR